MSDIFRLAILGQRILRSGDEANPQWHEMREQPNGSFSLPWPEYPASMQEFVQEASRKCWSDPSYDPTETERMINDRELVAGASLQQLRTMITYFVRGERFCDGHWAAMFQGGHVERLIDRLREFLPTFEYCSLAYLNMWLKREYRWVEAMRTGDTEAKLQAMANFAKAYRISRNLHLKHEVQDGVQTQRYGKVLSLIDSLTVADFAGDRLLPQLNEIRGRISEAYGDLDALSATTKFLWLKLQSPIVIFDRQARTALHSKHADIEDFYQRWRSSFEVHAPEIAQVCSQLFEMRRYCLDPNAVTTRFIEQVASRRWFHERVFDIFLWTVGGQPKAATSVAPPTGK